MSDFSAALLSATNRLKKSLTVFEKRGGSESDSEDMAEKARDNEEREDGATKTYKETKREIAMKDDVVTVTEIVITKKIVPGKEPIIKETRKVKEYKGEAGFKKLPDDIKARINLSKDQMATLQPVNLVAVKKNFVSDCLKEHNNYRKMHGVEPLKLSKHLVQVSEDRAKALAKSDKVQFQQDQTYGENISWVGSNDPNHVVDAVELMAKWYSEGDNYNYREEPKDLNAGHFTQMLWKGTKEFGIAAAKSSTNKIYVVAIYSPPGNYRGEFVQNVFPAGTRPSISSTKSQKSGGGSDDLNKESVEEHNSYRKLHGVPPLKSNKELIAYAQQWADQLAKEDKFQHRKERKYGENLYMYKSTRPEDLATAAAACKSWYSEIERHDFSREPKDLSTGHFTQMIWKSSREVGMGRAMSKSGMQVIVANYNPPGNVVGSYVENVPPPHKS